jgi:L-aspartate oxidase
LQRHEVDVLVIGAGLAGLTAALSAADRRVTVMCSWMPPAGTATAMAQGGIAAALDASDDPRFHWADTMRAGAGACNASAVRTLCGAAAQAIQWLESHGVAFDRDGDHLAFHREAAHSRPRVLHIDHDRTGFALIKAITRAARARPTVSFLGGYHAIALARDDDGVAGVLALDRKSQPCLVQASETVLATGGLGQFYSRTTNPRSACGDGLALAMAAGARCAALEFVQFHPTAIAVDSDPMPLVTEALRGAGAKLLDAQGSRFMIDAHPDAELAPRDVLAREVWRRSSAGGRTYLDAREVFAANPAAFPSVRSLCANQHLDPARELIPVAPAAHYHMGGVAVDLDGRSSLEHLWACGEVACTGVHGANRLASNSLLEAVVFGRRLGQALSGAGPRAASRGCDAGGPWRQGTTLAVDAAGWSELRALMWNHVGIVRDHAGLSRALELLARIEASLPANQVLLRNRARLAAAMAAAALERKTSCGAHFRADGTGSATPPGAVS